MTRGGREALTDVRETLPDVREWSEVPSSCLGVVSWHSWMPRSGRESLPVVWEWSEGSPGCPGVVGRQSRMFGTPSRISGSIRLALLDAWEWLGDPLGIAGVVGGPPGCQ